MGLEPKLVRVRLVNVLTSSRGRRAWKGGDIGKAIRLPGIPQASSWRIFDVYVDGCRATSAQEPSAQRIADVCASGKRLCVWLVLPACFVIVLHGSFRRDLDMSYPSTLSPYPGVAWALFWSSGTLILQRKVGTRCNSNLIFGSYVTAG